MYLSAMPRRIPESRLADLLKCATTVFIAQGYRRTQMSDVAEALGVAKGTVYLSVESKEALFAAALRYADTKPPSPSELDLPIPAPPPGALAAALRRSLERETIPPALVRAMQRARVRDVRAELTEIVRELYAASSRHRTGLKLLDSCGKDHPELADLYYSKGRFEQLAVLTRYIESRLRLGHLRPVPDPAVAARYVIEAIATWAIHIHWDPAPQPIDPVAAEETVVQLVVTGLVGQ